MTTKEYEYLKRKEECCPLDKEEMYRLTFEEVEDDEDDEDEES